MQYLLNVRDLYTCTNEGEIFSFEGFSFSSLFIPSLFLRGIKRSEYVHKLFTMNTYSTINRVCDDASTIRWEESNRFKVPKTPVKRRKVAKEEERKPVKVHDYNIHYLRSRVIYKFEKPVEMFVLKDNVIGMKNVANEEKDRLRGELDKVLGTVSPLCYDTVKWRFDDERDIIFMKMDMESAVFDNNVSLKARSSMMKYFMGHVAIKIMAIMFKDREASFMVHMHQIKEDEELTLTPKEDNNVCIF
jgi:hypothetical protein